MNKILHKVKVSIIEPVGGHGGMNYYDLGLCSGLAENEILVNLFTCDINPPVSLNPNFVVNPIFRKIYGASSKVLRGLRFVVGIIISMVLSKMSNTKISHFHFFHVGFPEFISVLISKIFFIKVVVTVHDVESFSAGLDIPIFVRLTYALVDRVIVHNETSMREVICILKIDASKINIIPHGSYVGLVSDSGISKVDARLKIGIPSDKAPILLFFGQIKEVKGLDLLLKAFSSVVVKYPGAQIVIAGKVWKDSFDKYSKYIEELSIVDNVSLHIRYIHDEEVEYFYRAADIVVLPYRKIYQSGVLLMAMSYGVPVLASDLDAMKEVIVDRTNGFLFKSNDANDLAEVLSDMIQHESMLLHATEEALRLMNAEFSWYEIGKKTAIVYKSLLN